MAEDIKRVVISIETRGTQNAARSIRDVEKNAQGLNKSVQRSSQTINKVGRDTRAFASTATREFARVSSASRRMESDLTRSLNSGTRGFQGLVGQTVRLRGAIAAIGAAAAVRQFTKFTDTATNLRNMLAQVTTGSKGLQSAWAGLHKAAQESFTSVESMGEGFVRLKYATEGLGLSQNELVKITRTLSKAVALTGADAATAERAMIQFYQGMSTGALRGQDLRSVLSDLTPFAARLAKELGYVSVGAFKAASELGALTPDRIVAALISMSDAVDKDFSKMELTVTRAFTKLSNSGVELARSFESTTGAASAFAQIISGSADILTAASKNMDILVASVQTAAVAFATLSKAAPWLRVTALIGAAGIAVAKLVTPAEKAKESITDLGNEMSKVNWDLGPRVRGVLRPLEEASLSFNNLKHSMDVPVSIAQRLEALAAPISRASLSMRDLGTAMNLPIEKVSSDLRQLVNPSNEVALALGALEDSMALPWASFSSDLNLLAAPLKTTTLAMSELSESMHLRGVNITPTLQDLIPTVNEAAKSLDRFEGSMDLPLADLGTNLHNLMYPASEATKSFYDLSESMRTLIPAGLTSDFQSLLDMLKKEHELLGLTKEVRDQHNLVLEAERKLKRPLLAFEKALLKQQYETAQVLKEKGRILQTLNAAENKAIKTRQALKALRREELITEAQYIKLVKELERNIRSQITTFKDYIGSLKQENYLLGMNREERAVRNALLDAEAVLNRTLTETEREKLTQQVKFNSALEREADLLRQIRGPEQDRARSISALTALLEKGKISQQEFNIASEDLRTGKAAQSTIAFGAVFEQFVNRTINRATNAMVHFAKTGEFSLSNFIKETGYEILRVTTQTFVSSAVKPIAKKVGDKIGAAIGGSIGTALGGPIGTALGAGVGALIGGIFGFRRGGSFLVGGTGGLDSQLVVFRATPGERVDIRTPEQVQKGSWGGYEPSLIANALTPISSLAEPLFSPHAAPILTGVLEKYFKPKESIKEQPRSPVGSGNPRMIAKAIAPIAKFIVPTLAPFLGTITRDSVDRFSKFKEFVKDYIDRGGGGLTAKELAVELKKWMESGGTPSEKALRWGRSVWEAFYRQQEGARRQLQQTRDPYEFDPTVIKDIIERGKYPIPPAPVYGYGGGWAPAPMYQAPAYGGGWQPAPMYQAPAYGGGWQPAPMYQAPAYGSSGGFTPPSSGWVDVISSALPAAAPILSRLFPGVLGGGGGFFGPPGGPGFLGGGIQADPFSRMAYGGGGGLASSLLAAGTRFLFGQPKPGQTMLQGGLSKVLGFFAPPQTPGLGMAGGHPTFTLPTHGGFLRIADEIPVIKQILAAGLDVERESRDILKKIGAAFPSPLSQTANMPPTIPHPAPIDSSRLHLAASRTAAQYERMHRPEPPSVEEKQKRERPVQVNIVNALNPSEVLDAIGTLAGENTILNVIKRNSRAVRRLLGNV